MCAAEWQARSLSAPTETAYQRSFASEPLPFLPIVPSPEGDPMQRRRPRAQRGGRLRDLPR